MKKSPSWGTNRSSACHLMELGGSLSYSQEPASCSNPKPDQSSQCPQLNSSRFILIISSYLRLHLPSGLFPSVSPPKPYMHLSFPQSVNTPRPAICFHFITHIIYGVGVDGWIILGWISRRWDVGIWTELGWSRIEIGGGRL